MSSRIGRLEILTAIKNFNIKLNPEAPAIVVVLKIGHYKTQFLGQFSTKEQDTRKDDLRQVIRKILIKHFSHFETTPFEEDCVSIIISIDNQNEHFDIIDESVRDKI